MQVVIPVTSVKDKYSGKKEANQESRPTTVLDVTEWHGPQKYRKHGWE